MKKYILKITMILVVFQMIFSVLNINTVLANSSLTSDIENQASKFESMGEGSSLLGTNIIISLTDPVSKIFALVHFAAVAFTTGKLLVTCFGIMKDDSLDKAKAKKSITIDLLLLFLALCGVPIVKEIILSL